MKNEPAWIEAHEAYAVHSRVLARNGGANGVRDEGLLLSALARARQLYTYVNRKADMIELAAAYTFGIVRNHPFVDGDKRTGFICGILFLETNGFRFNAKEEDAAQAIMQLAAGTFDEPSYAAFLRAHAKPLRESPK